MVAACDRVAGTAAGTRSWRAPRGGARAGGRRFRGDARRRPSWRATSGRRVCRRPTIAPGGGAWCRRGRRSRRAPSARAARGRPEGVGARARPAFPVLPDRAPAGWSVAPRRVMGDRRDADLCASRRRSWPAGARVTTEWPAVRVLARGGGGGPGREALRSLCLTQRRERRGRVDGAAHQLAKRALLRAACGRRGEHVFVKLRRASDGTRTLRTILRRSARIWLGSASQGS